MPDNLTFKARAQLSRWLRKSAYKEEFGVAERLRSRAEQYMSTLVKADAELAYPRAVYLMTGKAYKSYCSALFLARYGFTEDMGVVVRSLLNLDIVLKWISSADREARAKRYLGWFWVEMHRLLTVLPAPPDMEVAIQRQYSKVKRLFEFQSSKGRTLMPREWHNTNIKEMADQVGMTGYYDEYYKTLSATEHSSALSYFGMLAESGPGGTTVIGLGDHRFLRPYLECAFVCFSEVIYVWNEVFGVMDSAVLDGELSADVEFFRAKRNVRP